MKYNLLIIIGVFQKAAIFIQLDMAAFFLSKKGAGMDKSRIVEMFPEIEVHSPSHINTRAKFKANGQIYESNLISYTFQRSINNFGGSFNFTIKSVPNADVMDHIDPLDVVYIKENGICVFIGVVTNISYNAVAATLTKTITISGKGIEFLFQFLTITLNLTALNFTQSSLKSDISNIDNKLSTQNRSGAAVKDFVVNNFELFASVAADKAPALANTDVLMILKKMQLPIYSKQHSVSGYEKIFDIQSSLKLMMPLANNLVKDDVINFYDYLREILPQSIYEIFTNITDDGIASLVIRECPFDGEVDGMKNGIKQKVAGDWANLGASIKINPKILIDYTITKSMDEVYTAFYSYCEGSALSSDFYANLKAMENYYDDKNFFPYINEKKRNLYGFKPLRVNFIGFNTNLSNDESVKKNLNNTLKKLNERVGKWYGNLDEMFNATITVVKTYDLLKEDDVNYPEMGKKIEFLGGEFYVSGEQHSWRYGSSIRITYNCERGGSYDDKGNFSRLKNINAKLKELNLDNNDKKVGA